MTEAAVSVKGVTVKYGDKIALDSVSITVAKGDVYGLLGRNGAGKSSLIRCIAGLQKPAAGTIEVLGEDVWKRRASVMARCNYVPETFDAPEELSIAHVVEFHRSVYPKWDIAGFEGKLARLRLSSRAVLRTLSKGQKALVSLALALSSQPEVLILDDPTLGLDVVARQEFFSDFIGDLADRGTTVIMTTHDLLGVEGIANRIAILRGSRLAIEGSLDELKAEHGKSLERIFKETVLEGGAS